MTSTHKRGPAGTLQTRCWRVLRERGPLTIAQLAELLQHETEAVRRACKYMEARGQTLRDGSAGRQHLWHAVGRCAPRDLRGKRASSRNHRGQRAWQTWLRMMRRKMGPNWAPPPRGCALAECWRGAR